MQLLYITIIKNDSGKTAELCSEAHLDNFSVFTRRSIREMLSVCAEPVAKKTSPEERVIVRPEEGPDYDFHALGRPEGFCAIAVTDKEYPKVVVDNLLGKICADFVSKYPRSAYANVKQRFIKGGTIPCPFPELKDYIVKYQNPAEADSMMKVQKELDETKNTIYKTMESVLERGEKIDSLVAKSDGLSAQSKMFYTQAKKQNSCCVVM